MATSGQKRDKRQAFDSDEEAEKTDGHLRLLAATAVEESGLDSKQTKLAATLKSDLLYKDLITFYPEHKKWSAPTSTVEKSVKEFFRRKVLEPKTIKGCSSLDISLYAPLSIVCIEKFFDDESNLSYVFTIWAVQPETLKGKSVFSKHVKPSEYVIKMADVTYYNDRVMRETLTPGGADLVQHALSFQDSFSVTPGKTLYKSHWQQFQPVGVSISQIDTINFLHDKDGNRTPIGYDFIFSDDEEERMLPNGVPFMKEDVNKVMKLIAEKKYYDKVDLGEGAKPDACAVTERYDNGSQHGHLGNEYEWCVPTEGIAYQQPPGTKKCYYYAFVNVLAAMGVPTLILEQLITKGDSLWQSGEKEGSKKSVFHNSLAAATSGEYRVRNFKGEYNPLTASNLSEYPILASYKSRTTNISSHRIAIYRGRIYDPAEPAAMTLCRRNLDQLCGGKGEFGSLTDVKYILHRSKQPL